MVMQVLWEDGMAAVDEETRKVLVITGEMSKADLQAALDHPMKQWYGNDQVRELKPGDEGFVRAALLALPGARIIE